MREDRVNGVLVRALEGVTIDGTVLMVGGSAAARTALEEAGLTVKSWARFGKNGTLEPADGAVDRIALRLPKGRRNLVCMLHLMARHLAPEGVLWLHGANDEGIKSAGKTLKTLFDDVETVDSRKHSRLWQAAGRKVEPDVLASFEASFEATIGERTRSFVTLPGVFADGRLDEGTEHLLRAVTVEPNERVLDFGCGAGVIGSFIADRTEKIVGYDIDAWALHCARRNAPGDYRACDGWADVDGQYDHIISNPPFHTGKDTDFRVMGDLIEGAREKLRRKGRLTFVCPATAPVHRSLKAHFKSVKVLSDDRRYKVWEAS